MIVNLALEESTRFLLRLPRPRISVGISFALGRCIIYKLKSVEARPREVSSARIVRGRAVPETDRIIKRRRHEVNGSRASRVKFFSCARWLSLIVVVVVLLAMTSACGGRESKAERLYKKAQRHIEADELSTAITKFEEIVNRYPDTEVARRARKELVLFQGLDLAVREYSSRSARDLMIHTARALQSSRWRRRAWPESLDRLMPDLLHEPPIDPWGRPLSYQRKPRNRGYVLSCYGSDGKPGGLGKAADIHIEDGEFVSRPPTVTR